MSGAISEMKHVMEYLVDQRIEGVDPRSFSDLFERVTWLQADNGNSIRSVLSEWLESPDIFRVKVALGLEEAFLFDTRENMVDAFRRIEARWPELTDRCSEIVEAWDRSVGSMAAPQ
jgi:hypothetical protein